MDHKQISEEHMMDALLRMGLTQEEAETFMQLVKKLKVDQNLIDDYDKCWAQDIPFEGGMGPFEAVYNLAYLYNNREPNC